MKSFIANLREDKPRNITVKSDFDLVAPKMPFKEIAALDGRSNDGQSYEMLF